MTEKKRTGRPSNIKIARQDLAHRELLERKCAQLGILIDQIADGEITDDDADAELGKIAAALKNSDFEPEQRSKNISAPNTNRLKLLDSLATLQARREYQKAIAHSVSNLITQTNFEIERVKQQLLHSVKGQPKVVSYQHKLLQKLAAAGITKHNASQISVSGLKTMLNEGSSPPISTTQVNEVIDNETVNYSVWSDLLIKGQKQYSITAKPISLINNQAEAHDLVNGDYPPFTDLADYGQPELLEKFKAAKLPQDRKNLVYEICRLWFVETHGDRKSSELWNKRKDTWPFLLALKYNFANDIPDMKEVNLPGPHPCREFFLAKRL